MRRYSDPKVRNGKFFKSKKVCHKEEPQGTSKNLKKPPNTKVTRKSTNVNRKCPAPIWVSRSSARPQADGEQKKCGTQRNFLSKWLTG